VSGEEKRITYAGHATVRIELDGAAVLTDPILKKRVAHLRRRSQPVSAAVVEGLDAVLISHLHYDHLDMASLKSLAAGTEFIVPRGAGQLLASAGLKSVTEISEGESMKVGRMVILAVKAAHDGRRRPHGAQAETLGYVVGGESKVYFAGDTDIFPEMTGMAGNVDLALLPVWGWGPTLGDGHMDPDAAAEAAAMIKPPVAVPIHWGTFFPMGMKRWQERFLVRPPIQFRDRVRELAPETEVKILQPGESLTLD
jgi:L-ascorbate metabolism protein UlaG (beta-lactamase superfamily)